MGNREKKKRKRKKEKKGKRKRGKKEKGGEKKVKKEKKGKDNEKGAFFLPLQGILQFCDNIPESSFLLNMGGFSLILPECLTSFASWKANWKQKN